MEGSRAMMEAHFGPEPTEAQKAAREASKRFVESLELSVRTANCLINAGVTCWEDVERMGRAYWMSQPNFGRKSMADLEGEMRLRGREFKIPSTHDGPFLSEISTRDLVRELARRFGDG